MEGSIDFKRDGDYYVSLTREDVEHLQNKTLLTGKLKHFKDGIRSEHKLTIHVKTSSEIRELKKDRKHEGKTFREGPHVTIFVDDTVHTAYYEEGHIDFEKLLNDSMHPVEHRYCSHLSRKILLYVPELMNE